ncbi:hypothetical protein [Alteromonas sp. 14N.309.X.WAT.G.H12]|uniref:hypothetical protein n=1 Tax=Alteromonas sp. 14N.309.X.WAT.G.H12 TaxID=3120824 RepID=UPI002FCFE8CF
MNIRRLRGLLSIGLPLCVTPVLAEDASIMDFDLDTSSWEEFGDDWRYARPYDQSCDYMETQSKLCKGTHRFYMYYNSQNNDHIGWLRYGYFVPTGEFSIDGNALRVVYTGGAKSDDDGETVELGEEIRGYYQYLDAYAEKGDAVFADETLPATPTIYYHDHYTTSSLGIFDDANRFTTYVWRGRDDDPYVQYDRDESDVSTASRTLAWYPFIDSAVSSHYYHQVSNRAFGGWLKAEFDANPTHTNAGITNDNGSLPLGGNHYPYDAYSYFENVASFAVRFLGLEDSDSPASVVTDEWTKSDVKYENDYTISSLGVSYDPVTGNFDISFEDKYRCLDCAAKYEVRYSFSSIDVSNFDQASEFESVENFFSNDDNEAGEITKPNNGYNQNWAYLILPYDDAVRFKSGDPIYFAVKDISDRDFDYDITDDELVSTPWGEYRQRDLIRTLQVDYHETPIALDNDGNTVDYTPLGGQIGISIEIDRDGLVAFMNNPPLYNETGYLESNWFSVGDDTGDATEYCSVNLECEEYVLADLVTGSVGTNDFATLTESTQEMAVEDFEGNAISSKEVYNQIVVEGAGITLDPTDTITFTIKNVSGTSGKVTPRVTSYINGRPELMNSKRYYQLTQTVDDEEEMDWVVPASDFAGESLTSVLISIPQSADYEVTSIKLNTMQEISCSGCGDLLVDYFEDGGATHTFGYETWTNVVNHTYTKQIGDGYGIAVGSNSGYDSVAITGETALTDDTATAHVVWLNYSDETYTFTPRYNLNEVGRPGLTTTEWYDSNEVVIAPGGSAEQLVPIDTSTRVININVGIDNPGDLSLDKITITD